ncbi:MAG: hypothetical protein ACI9WU_001133 [Myxococcota bacterium]|jgi:hypothetical protein
MRLALVSLRLIQDLRRPGRRWRRRQDQRHLIAAFGRLVVLVGTEAANQAMAAVQQRLHSRHRASSAIEGTPRCARIYVHKGVTPGFLALFQAWYNLRTRGAGAGTRAPARMSPSPASVSTTG